VCSTTTRTQRTWLTFRFLRDQERGGIKKEKETPQERKCFGLKREKGREWRRNSNEPTLTRHKGTPTKERKSEREM